MDKKKDVKNSLANAEKPKELAMQLHPFYKGKIGTAVKVPVRTINDFSIWYTPGVAEPCKEIQRNKDSVFELTSKWNFVAIVSDCSRVLGLGNIGPEAGLPVMEGKALLFKYLGGVDAFPICLKTQDPNEIIRAVNWLTPTFGGINLEDIASPKCYHILKKLRDELDIPVWHDDQQGTALVTLAGLINALKIVNKKLEDVSIALIGAGAANINVAKYLAFAGAKYENMTLVDSKGVLHQGRKDLQESYPMKWELCMKTNKQGKTGAIAKALKDTDVCIAYSKPGPGTIKKEWVSNMADEAIILAGANPVPEIWPWEAKEAGARIVATGRSEIPNQINNSLGFPAVFRGALDAAAKKITDEMCITAAYAIAEYAEKKGIHERYIIPAMDETEMYIEEAVAVGLKATEQGITRHKVNKKELRKKVSENIKSSQETTKLLMSRKIIKPFQH
ncbi:NADP-dependent malic enzyme [Candidatus Bathyarchaeota archaeon]|nr:NADP-dependent malic enzyme [Candidatus Bathyarchaeota archaeon]